MIHKRLGYLSKTETKRTTYADSQHIKSLKNKRDALKKTIDGGTANASEISEYIRLADDIAAATNDRKRAMYDTIEDIAYNMGQRHDIGSGPMFRPYKPKGGAHWTNATALADWTDPSNPIFTGEVEREPECQAHAQTPYWSNLFKAKPTVPASARRCLELPRTYACRAARESSTPPRRTRPLSMTQPRCRKTPHHR